MLLGLDLGTGSLKALLLSPNGDVVAETARHYTVAAPRPGTAETAPAAWWEATCSAVQELAAGRSGEITALGLSGQMHGVVLVDAAGEVLRPAILWADLRSAPLLPRYREQVGDDLARLKNPLSAGMAGPTLLALLEQEAEMLRAVRWVLQPKDWLRYRLTGEIAAEPSDASGTLLFDVAAGRWLDGLIGRLGFERSWFAPLIASSTVAGTVSPEAAAALGLRPGLPVVAGGSDTACAALGSGLTRPGDAQLTVGTGAQLIVLQDAAEDDTGDAAKDFSARGVHLFRTVAGPPYYALAAVQNAGLALEWVRTQLELSWDEMYARAFAVGSSGVTFVPYLTGERTPHLDADVRGMWAGLALHHTSADLARAAFEGVAFSLRDALDALGAGSVTNLRLAGGGTLEPRWQQLLADALAQPLQLSGVPAASAVGAAWLAGLGTGVLEGVPSPALGRVVVPAADLSAPYERFRDLYRRLQGWDPKGPKHP